MPSLQPDCITVAHSIPAVLKLRSTDNQRYVAICLGAREQRLLFYFLKI